jgi:Ca-activated chloride channel family protein
MSWLHPTYLWALAAVPVAALLFFWARRQRRLAMHQFGDRQLLSRLMTGMRPRRRGWKAGIIILAVLCLGLALAGPRIGTELREVERKGIDVVLALDVSQSMQARDVQPSRLDRARLEIENFVNELSGDRVGLVLFAGEAFLQCPLTLDYSALQLYLDAADPSAISTPGTNFSAAVRAGIQAFEERSPNAGDERTRAMVIISDGEDHEQQARQALRKARDRGIEIFTTGVGETEGAPVPVYNNRGRQVGYKRTSDGQRVQTRLEETYLRELAGADHYFRIANHTSNFSDLLDNLAKLDRTTFARGAFETYRERFQWPLAAALLLLSVEPMISIYRRKTENRFKATT